MTAITETNNFLGHFVYSWAQRLIHFGLLHHIALPFLVCRPTSLYLHPFALFVSYNFKLSTILHTKLVYTSMYVYTGSLASCLHLQRFVCILRPFFSVLFDVVASRWVNSLCNWHAFTLIQCSTIYQQLCLSSSLCCWYCLLSILVWLLLVYFLMLVVFCWLIVVVIIIAFVVVIIVDVIFVVICFTASTQSRLVWVYTHIRICTYA